MIADKISRLKKQLSQRVSVGTSVVVRQKKGQSELSELKNGAWQLLSSNDQPQPSVFSRQVLLIPEQETAFCRQTYPVDLVSEKGLLEAVTLSLDSWSPYGANSKFFSMHEKQQGQWHVAIWVWPADLHKQWLSSTLGRQCTHVMPEIAWYCGRVTRAEPIVLVVKTELGSVYVYLNDNGLPVKMTKPNSPSEATRFWRGIGADANNIKQLIVADEGLLKQQFNLPTQLKISALSKSEPKAKWLKQAQIEGVNDWFNPRNWLKPASAVLSLALIWLMTDALLIQHKNEQVGALISQAKLGAEDVLRQQDKINASVERLRHYAMLKQRQKEPEYILAELSKRIPSNIWLDAIQLDNRWLDIRGRGKDVIRLLGLLEAIKGVDDIVLLNDVRPDLRTGEEQFQIRLILDEWRAGEPKI
jgi:hypothetical protein